MCFDFTDIKYITEDVHNNLLKRSQLQENDLLMTITGRIGTCAVVTKDCLPANINQHIVRIRLKNGYNPHFVAAYLNSDIGLLLSNRGVTGTTRIALDYESIKKIPFPNIVDENKQQSLFDILDFAIKERKEKQVESNYLLSDLSTVMMNKLNLSLDIYGFSKCFFAVNLRDILLNKTHRFDPKCYSNKYTRINESLNRSEYIIYKLKDLVISNTSGDWGKPADIDSDLYTKCLVLRATEIDNSQNIRINEDKSQFRAIPIKTLEKQDIEIGDILVEKSGGSKDQPVGRVVYIDSLEYNNHPISYSNFLTKLKINKDLVDPYYLFEYLRFVYDIGLTEVMQNQTNGIRNLIMDEFLNLTVIVPPNNYEIGQNSKAIRKKALLLDQEAEQEWQEAKKQFEKELLGE